MDRPKRALRLTAALAAVASFVASRGARAEGTIDLEVGRSAEIRSALRFVDLGNVESESYRFRGAAGDSLSLSVVAPRRSAQRFDVGLYDDTGMRQVLAAQNVVSSPGRWKLRDVRLPSGGLWEVRVTSDVGGTYRMRLAAGRAGRPLRLDLRPDTSDAAGVPETAVALLIPPSGGLLTPVPHLGEEPLLGTFVSIPAGAFARDTRVVLTGGTAPPLDDPVRQRAIGAAFRLLPDDLQFAVPARIMMRIGADGLPLGCDPAEVRVLAVDPRGRRSVIVPADVQIDRGSLTFETSRGGTFVPWIPRGKPSLAWNDVVEMRLSVRLEGPDADGSSVAQVVTSSSRSRYHGDGPLARDPYESSLLWTGLPGGTHTLDVSTAHEPTFAPSWRLTDDGRSAEVVRQDGAVEAWDVADDASVLVQRSGGPEGETALEFGAAVHVDLRRALKRADVAGTWAIGETGMFVSRGPAGTESLQAMTGTGTLVLRADGTWEATVTERTTDARRGGARAPATATRSGTFEAISPEDGMESAQSLLLTSSSSASPGTLRLVFTSSLSAFVGVSDPAADQVRRAAVFVAGTRRVARLDRRLAAGEFAGSAFLAEPQVSVEGGGATPLFELCQESRSIRLPGDGTWTAAAAWRKEIVHDGAGAWLAVVAGAAADDPVRCTVSPRAAIATAGSAGGFAADGAFGFLVVAGGTPSPSRGLLLFVRSQ